MVALELALLPLTSSGRPADVPVEPLPAAAGVLGRLHGLRPRLQRRPEDDGHHHARALQRRRHPRRSRSRPGSSSRPPRRSRWAPRSAAGGSCTRWATASSSWSRSTASPPRRPRPRSSTRGAHFGIPRLHDPRHLERHHGRRHEPRLRGVRWGVARRILFAWVLTIPAAGVVGAAHLVRPQRARLRLSRTRSPACRLPARCTPEASDGPPDPPRREVLRPVHRGRREPARGRPRARGDGQQLRPARRAGRPDPGAREAAATRSTTRSARGCRASFITPFDREDIHELVVHLDDVVDGIQATAETFVIYGITAPDDDVKQLVGLLAGQAVQLLEALTKLESQRDVVPHLQQIHELEHKADALSRAAIGRLFKGGMDPLEVIKLRDLYTVSRRRSTPPRTRPRSSSGSSPRPDAGGPSRARCGGRHHRAQAAAHRPPGHEVEPPWNVLSSQPPRRRRCLADRSPPRAPPTSRPAGDHDPEHRALEPAHRAVARLQRDLHPGRHVPHAPVGVARGARLRLPGRRRRTGLPAASSLPCLRWTCSWASRRSGRIIGASDEEFRALQATARIRHAYLEIAPTRRAVPLHRQPPTTRTACSRSTARTSAARPACCCNLGHGLTTMPGMIAVLDAALVGGARRVGRRRGCGGDARLALVVGIAAGVTALLAFMAYGIRTFTDAQPVQRGPLSRAPAAGEPAALGVSACGRASSRPRPAASPGHALVVADDLVDRRSASVSRSCFDRSATSPPHRTLSSATTPPGRTSWTQRS